MTDVPTTVKNKDLVEKRRKQIILAAIRLFSEKGFHKTTLREIAEEAELSHGNIYGYFGNKEQIFFLIHDFLAGSAMEILARSTENIDHPIDKLRRMVRGEFNLMSQWPDALLLIYQESHILMGSLLKELLEKERSHLEKFEAVIAECVDKGLLRDCNVRLTANLIKSMVDSWTLKRWDLRGHVTQNEAESFILDLLFNGLLQQKRKRGEPQVGASPLQGRSALVVNGGTLLGTAICSFLVSSGVKVVSYANQLRTDRESPVISSQDLDNIKFYFAQEHGPMTLSLFRKMEEDLGPFDIYIHDIGIGNTEPSESSDGQMQEARLLNDNLRHALDNVVWLQEQLAERALGRILFLAPWAWDKFVDPIAFETVKAGVVALTEAMAKKMASTSVNVNCIIPGFIRAVRPSQLEKQRAAQLASEIPLGCLGDITDVTDAVGYLIGDTSKYVTGQVLKVTGGIN